MSPKKGDKKSKQKNNNHTKATNQQSSSSTSVKTTKNATAKHHYRSTNKQAKCGQQQQQQNQLNSMSSFEKLKRLQDITSQLEFSNDDCSNEFSFFNINNNDGYDGETGNSQQQSFADDQHHHHFDLEKLKREMNKLNLNHPNSTIRDEQKVISSFMNNPFDNTTTNCATSNDQQQQHQQQHHFNKQPSRLPSYIANGQPLGYKQPSINYQLHQSISSNNFRSDSRLSNSSLVPSEVSTVHNSHLTSNSCSNSNSKKLSSSPFNNNHHHQHYHYHCMNSKQQQQQKQQFSAPNSLIVTPFSSSPVTPADSRRSSKQMKKSESESFSAKDLKYFKSSKQNQNNSNSSNAAASTKSSMLMAKANLNNKTFKFEEYMPLCKVQNMLAKGQIVEGVLRINQRNFEDAYISAPVEGEIDIKIFGKKNINRAFNNDVVAVKINPINQWNIQYNIIQANWSDWKDEIMDVLQAKQASLESKLNDQCLEGEHINFDHSSSIHHHNCDIIEEEDNHDDCDDDQDNSNYDAAATVQNNDNDEEYESAQEDISVLRSDFDDRIYLTEEFFPDDKQYDLASSLIEKKVTMFADANKTTTVVTKRTVHNLDGVNLQTLCPEDLINCSFSKRCLQQTGKVVSIIKPSNNRICGGRLRIQSIKSDFVVFETTDKRIPNFLVPISECPSDYRFNPNFYRNSLFLGEIKKWPATSKYPFGRLVKMVGSAGEIETETEILLTENNVDCSEFPDNIEKGLPITPNSETFDIPAKEIKKRRDMRDECIFTIDPATARDLDDALSIRKLSKHSIRGKEIYEVGVHIADVSYFVKENLPIDQVAKLRTTSIYCVQKVIPMLPRILCEKYCSLNAGEDKLTFSVFWHMNSNGEIVKEWFERTVIKSCIKLSYDIAADMIDRPEQDWNSIDGLPELHNSKYTYNDIVESVNLLNEIAKNLRTKRFKHGSLEISKPEVRFVLDETRYNVLGFTTDKPKSTSLVEEFMLLANISVAKKIYTKYPSKSFLRRHPMPDKKMVTDFEELCKNASLNMDISSSKQLQSSLNEIKKKVDDDSYRFLSLKLLKCLRPAEYFTTMKLNNYNAFQHYALCVPIYTHFTSPIRRYPDIIVHRLLAAALNLEKEPKFKLNEMDDLVVRCNDMKLANRIVSETSQKLFLSVYILSVGSITQSAIVMQVFDQAFDCFLTKLNVTLRVYCNQLDLDHVEHNHLNDSLKLFYQNNPQNYVLIKMLTKVNLKITIPDKCQLLKWHAILV